MFVNGFVIESLSKTLDAVDKRITDRRKIMKIPVTKQITQKTLIFALMMLVVGLAGATNLIAQNNLDPTFGNGGKVITDFNRVDYAFAVVLQPDGKLIVAGSSFNTVSPDFLIARYNGDAVSTPPSVMAAKY